MLTSHVSFARILCPTDFSEFSDAALTYAAALADTYGGAVRLLHVVTPFPVIAPYSNLPGETRLYETARAAGEEALAGLAARVRTPGLTVDVEQRSGAVVHEILQVAGDWQADVIVMGTHGRGGFERLVLGSVAEKVLRKAPCAVLAVPKPAVAAARLGTVRLGHLLCPVDGSAASVQGVAAAASLTERCDARLTLVSVVESIPYGGDFVGPEFAAFREARERHARAVLDEALPSEVRVRCRVRDRLVYGHPAQQILEVAAQEQPDLIVMGIQGRGAVDLAMFGSTTNHVVRHADQPVLTVRPPAATA